MKSWNEMRKAATAFSKRWKDAYDHSNRRIRKIVQRLDSTDAHHLRRQLGRMSG